MAMGINSDGEQHEHEGAADEEAAASSSHGAHAKEVCCSRRDFAVKQSLPHFFRVLASLGFRQTMQRSLFSMPKLLQFSAFAGISRQVDTEAKEMAMHKSMQSVSAVMTGADGDGATR